jgi:hypothetical protein
MSQPSFPEALARALAWYESRRDELHTALPITWRGGTYHSLARLEADIAEVRAGRLTGRLAEAYVLGPIRNLRDFYLEVLKRGDS